MLWLTLCGYKLCMLSIRHSWITIHGLLSLFHLIGKLLGVSGYLASKKILMAVSTSCLLAKGFLQTIGFDLTETFFYVIKLVTI
jgi:hypothetical protein